MVNVQTENHGVNLVIAQIRRDFVASLLQRSLTLEALKLAAAAAQDKDQAVFEIGAMAHKIAGVAGTLGFDRLSEISLALDTLIGPAGGGNHATPESWTKVQDLVETLLDEMEALMDQADS